MLIAPMDRSTMFMGKVISVSLFTLAMELILIPVLSPYPISRFIDPSPAANYAGDNRVCRGWCACFIHGCTDPCQLCAGAGVVVAAEFAGCVGCGDWRGPTAMGLNKPPFADVSATFALVIAYDLLMLAAGLLPIIM